MEQTGFTPSAVEQLVLLLGGGRVHAPTAALREAERMGYVEWNRKAGLYQLTASGGVLRDETLQALRR